MCYKRLRRNNRAVDDELGLAGIPSGKNGTVVRAVDNMYNVSYMG
jgi:hypothetical protein